MISWEKGSGITERTITFIDNWIRTGPAEKGKAFFDVWDIVLRNYLPTTRPVLFRTCAEIGKDGKIVSFTARLECARRFAKDNSEFLIICDTKETLMCEEEVYRPGEYEHTFYPLVEVLKKAESCGGCGFSQRLLDDYIGEDEYIMRINLTDIHCFKWK